MVFPGKQNTGAIFTVWSSSLGWRSSGNRHRPWDVVGFVENSFLGDEVITKIILRAQPTENAGRGGGTLTTPEDSDEDELAASVVLPVEQHGHGQECDEDGASWGP